MRADGRSPDALRPVEIQMGFVQNPAGSALTSFSAETPSAVASLASSGSLILARPVSTSLMYFPVRLMVAASWAWVMPVRNRLARMALPTLARAVRSVFSATSALLRQRAFETLPPIGVSRRSSSGTRPTR